MSIELEKLFHYPRVFNGGVQWAFVKHSIRAVTWSLLLWVWIMKAVLFDLGGVLISAPQLVIARYEKSLGLPS